MNNLPAIIAYILQRPISGPNDLVRLRDDGDGPYISHWDASLGPEPTEAQLKAADKDALAWHARRQKRAEYERRAERAVILERAKQMAEADHEADLAAEIQQDIDALTAARSLER